MKVTIVYASKCEVVRMPVDKKPVLVFVIFVATMVPVTSDQSKCSIGG